MPFSSSMSSSKLLPIFHQNQPRCHRHQTEIHHDDDDNHDDDHDDDDGEENDEDDDDDEDDEGDKDDDDDGDDDDYNLSRPTTIPQNWRRQRFLM